MNLADYQSRYKERTDVGPGWEAIDLALEGIYGGQKPEHWGTLVKGFLGGPDPIDGISMYRSSAGGREHRHFCSYGFSNLYYDEEAFGKEFSRWGFELTFRLAESNVGMHDPVWVCNVMQNLGRYVFQSEKWFEEFHWIPANGPICLDSDTSLVGLAFVRDSEVPPLDTPHGRVELLQMVGITGNELDAIRGKQRTCADVIEHLRVGNPLLITDLARQ